MNFFQDSKVIIICSDQRNLRENKNNNFLQILQIDAENLKIYKLAMALFLKYLL